MLMDTELFEFKLEQCIQLSSRKCCFSPLYRSESDRSKEKQMSRMAVPLKFGQHSAKDEAWRENALRWVVPSLYLLCKNGTEVMSRQASIPLTPATMVVWENRSVLAGFTHMQYLYKHIGREWSLCFLKTEIYYSEILLCRHQQPDKWKRKKKGTA